MRYVSSEEVFQPEHRYVLTTIRCPECKNDEKITVRAGDLFKYNQGTFMQDAFP